MKLIVGLGNPGAKYRGTRHNIGFRVLDEVARRLGTAFTREKFKGQIAEGGWSGEKILLLKPLTFMNLSGESVAQAARNHVNDSDDLLIVYDEAELPLARLRMRARGSAGSHNGMRSVIERVGHQDIPRLRIGVGRGTGGGNLAEHVLATFRPEEGPLVEQAIARSADAVLEWIEHGTESAMNRFNRDEPSGGANNDAQAES